ncbi:PEP-CTERM sorting domain-containing protein [Verrucomicrobiota bacterium sgz303538]
MKTPPSLCAPIHRARKQLQLPSSLMLLAATPVLLSSLASAQTLSLVDSFDGAGPLAVPSQLGSGPGPAIMTEGAASFLRLLAGANSQNNHYTYDRPDTITGGYDTISASFDFRVLPGTAGLADGFSFMLIPTSNFSTSGDGPNPTAEEPNVAGTFGIGFDLYPGINNVSAHWDGAQQAEHAVPQADVDGVNFRNNQVFNNALITLQRVGNGTNVSVTLTPDSLGAAPGTPYKAFEIALPNMLPYENRVQFSGRTGGENLTLDLDNLKVNYSNPFAGIEAAPTDGRHVYQDFDRSGTSKYQVVQNAQRDATTFRPGPKLVAGDAGSKGAFLRITQDGVNGQSNQVAFDRAFDGGASNMTEVLDFDVRISSNDQPADGMGILFLPTNTTGVTGIGLPSSEEPNHVGVLGIGFDVYPNGDPEPGAPSISLHWNNNKVVDLPITDPSIALNQFHHLQVIREPVNGGLNVSVIATPNINGAAGAPVTLLDHVFVAGARNYDYRLEFAARTGGADASHDIDNIATSQLSKAPLANTQTNFTTGNGAAWKAYRFGDGAAPELKNDGFSNGQYLRLIHDGNNGQINSIAFDRQLDGLAASATGVKVNFDFRITNDPAAFPADGFSMMLIPTGTFGTTGPGVAGTVPGFIAEEPNVTGVFGLGIDVYRDGVTPMNEVSLHWDGLNITSNEIPTNLIDLVAGMFHRATLELTLEGGRVLADLVLTPNIYGEPGAPVTVFTDFEIPGMTSFYDYRLEFAGRTGGLNTSVDLDNILVQTVPEPSSALLVAAGVGLLATRRRRRAAAVSDVH